MDIVVGYVDRPAGHAALAAGVAEARLRGAFLHVIHAARIAIRNESPEQIARAHAHMEELDGRLRTMEVPGRAGLDLSHREPGDALLDEVDRLGAGLLVVGARRRSAVGKLLLGSTVQHLLLRAPCDVLVVKAGPEADAWDGKARVKDIHDG